MIDAVEKLKNNFDADLQSGMDHESLRIKYTARKGALNDVMALFKGVPNDQKKAFGQAVNQLKQHIENALNNQSETDVVHKEADIDLTLPGRSWPTAKLHPLTQVMNDVKRFFKRYGFQIADGPEIEDDYHNFEALNIPADHPARDMHDTLFTNNGLLLRSHTSNVQIRVMENQQPPIRLIAPGRVYRKDTPDATHSPVFTQVEGLVVDEGISFADLKGIIEAFAEYIFGPGIKVRFRPSYFPFTEPSFEYDFGCPFCKGKGCRVCKHTGWIEISGAGMVDPNVFDFVKYDAEKYSGYAFGMGLERIAMVKYQIDDIRLFYENDMRFLNQF
ncbi:MAG: phenylalanine--tRNA ligase subunit alpha [Calditrichaeota bacterium]|nr:phenylalanine--tRNA ligase subunit alpha [Calditrichota bacterium]